MHKQQAHKQARLRAVRHAAKDVRGVMCWGKGLREVRAGGGGALHDPEGLG